MPEQRKSSFVHADHPEINPRMGTQISSKSAASPPPLLTLDRSVRLAPHAVRLMLGGGREKGLRRFRCAMCDHFGPNPHTRVKLRSPNCAFDAFTVRSGRGWRNQAPLTVPPDAPDQNAFSRIEYAARAARALDLFACAFTRKTPSECGCETAVLQKSYRGKSRLRGGGG